VAITVIHGAGEGADQDQELADEVTGARQAQDAAAKNRLMAGR
jgi:hypothetical protein